MTYGLFQKRVDRKYCPIHPFKKRRKSLNSSSENKENLFQHLNFKANKTNAAECLYADSSFMNQATKQKYGRLEGGEEEIFYDCFPFECDHENQSEKQQNIQIFEVINEIRNPKEFKSLLKQMAFTANVLYRTFRQAYSRTRRNKQKVAQTSCKTCDEAYQNLDDLFNRGYRNPLEIINIEVPPSRHDYLEDVRYECWPKGRHKKKKSASYQQFPVQEEHPCNFGTNYNETNEKYQKFCSNCLGCLDDDDVLYCNKCCPKIFKTKIWNENPTDATSHQTNFPKFFSETPTCLKETNVCLNYDEGLQNLDFCDRCAALRGELFLPPKTEENPQFDSKTEVNEKSSQTCQQENYSKKDKTIKSDTSAKLNQPSVKQTLNLNPVCVTIPLKLQIDSQNCQSRFIETEIVMEAFSGSQSKTPALSQKPESTQKCTSLHLDPLLPKMCTRENKTENFQKKSCSDTFYSCLSCSGIIKPEETQHLRGELALNEVLEIIRKRKPNLPESYLPSVVKATKPVEESKSETKGIQISLADDSVKANILEPKVFSSQTGSTQTEPKIKRAQQKAVPSIQQKAQQLRSDLLQEVRAALEQTSPTAALKALLEGKRFSLPADLKPKEISAAIQARYSLPSNYPVIPSSAASLSPLRPIITTTFSGSQQTTRQKPVLPPKPILPPPKPIAVQTETVQKTDASLMKPSRHAQRSKLRTEIQEELKELLEPNSSKSQPIYSPEARDEILLDLHKLFHPKKAGTLPKQMSQENALQAIRNLFEMETDLSSSAYQPQKSSESQESILQSIRYILNPKSLQKPRKRKYTKDTEEKILEDLKILLTPPSANREIRSSVLYDLRFMLDTGRESTSPQRPLRLSQIEPTEAQNADPISSRALQVRQERQQKPPNEKRDSLIHDLRHLLDSTLIFQGNASTSLEQSLSKAREAAKNIPTRQKTSATTNKSQTSISSETSLSDADKEH